MLLFPIANVPQIIAEGAVIERDHQEDLDDHRIERWKMNRSPEKATLLEEILNVSQKVIRGKENVKRSASDEHVLNIERHPY